MKSWFRLKKFKNSHIMKTLFMFFFSKYATNSMKSSQITFLFFCENDQFRVRNGLILSRLLQLLTGYLTIFKDRMFIVIKWDKSELWKTFVDMLIFKKYFTALIIFNLKNVVQKLRKNLPKRAEFCRPFILCCINLARS